MWTPTVAIKHLGKVGLAEFLARFLRCLLHMLVCIYQESIFVSMLY